MHLIIAREFLTNLITIQQNLDRRMGNDVDKIHRNELRRRITKYTSAVDALTQAARTTAVNLKAISACSYRLFDLLNVKRSDP